MDGYEKYLNKLAELPIRSPRSDSGVELEILKKFMTPEEAEIASNLTGVPEPAGAIAERANMSVEVMKDALDSLTKKGVIFKIYAEEPLYALFPMTPGVLDSRVHRSTPEETELWWQYYEEKWAKAMFTNKTPFLRTVPIKESIPTEMTVFTYEEVEQLIDNAQSILLQDCICRSSRKTMGKACDAPVKEMCIWFDDWAKYFFENNQGRLATREEAKQTLARAKEAGLVCNTLNVEHGSIGICACCGCCCLHLRAVNDLALPGAVASSNFIAEVAPDHCVGCGVCVDACQIKALELRDNVAHLIEGRCIGCGVCSLRCEFDAISLKRRPEESRPPTDIADLMEKVASGYPEA